jgi:hypothetical protein
MPSADASLDDEREAMGYDVSNLAVDVRLIRERLVPYMRRATSDGLEDLVRDAARRQLVSYRASRWCERVVNLQHAIYADQAKAVREHAGAPPGEFSSQPVRGAGIPGFNAYQAQWGRPYFIEADDAEDALRELAAYEACDITDESAIDAVALRMLAKLDARRHLVGPEVRPEVRAVLDGFYPLAAHLPPEESVPDEAMTPDALMARMRRRLEQWRHIWECREDTTTEIDAEGFMWPEPASELVGSISYEILNLAAQVLPSWQNRGRVWPTALFERIGVDVSHVFETPASLFADLLRDFPMLQEKMRTTIHFNYSLGGYVPPEKTGLLVELLQKHRRALIFAWDEDPGDDDIEAFASDYQMILEPALLAVRKGYGFVEASEIQLWPAKEEPSEAG